MLTAGDPLRHRPRRVIVAGVSGSGKTTLAARIAAITGDPHTEIDGLFHGPGWEPRPSFADDVHALAATDSWTTEWQYTAARDILAERADLLVWLDYPFLRVTLPRVIRRTLHRSRSREVLWNGNVEPPLWTAFTRRDHIVRWAIATRRKYHTLVPELQRTRPDLTIVRLRSPAETEAWLTGPLRAVAG